MSEGNKGHRQIYKPKDTSRIQNKEALLQQLMDRFPSKKDFDVVFLLRHLHNCNWEVDAAEASIRKDDNDGGFAPPDRTQGVPFTISDYVPSSNQASNKPTSTSDQPPSASDKPTSALENPVESGSSQADNGKSGQTYKLRLKSADESASSTNSASISTVKDKDQAATQSPSAPDHASKSYSLKLNADSQVTSESASSVLTKPMSKLLVETGAATESGATSSDGLVGPSSEATSSAAGNKPGKHVRRKYRKHGNKLSAAGAVSGGSSSDEDPTWSEDLPGSPSNAVTGVRLTRSTRSSAGQCDVSNLTCQNLLTPAVVASPLHESQRQFYDEVVDELQREIMKGKRLGDGWCLHAFYRLYNVCQHRALVRIYYDSTVIDEICKLLLQRHVSASDSVKSSERDMREVLSNMVDTEISDVCSEYKLIDYELPLSVMSESPKLDSLLEILTTLQREGSNTVCNVVIFTHIFHMLKIIYCYLSCKGFDVTVLSDRLPPSQCQRSCSQYNSATSPLNVAVVHLSEDVYGVGVHRGVGVTGGSDRTLHRVTHLILCDVVPLARYRHQYLVRLEQLCRLTGAQCATAAATSPTVYQLTARNTVEDIILNTVKQTGDNTNLLEVVSTALDQVIRSKNSLDRTNN